MSGLIGLTRLVRSAVTALALFAAVGYVACRDAPVSPPDEDTTKADTAFTLQRMGFEFPVFRVGQQQEFLVIAHGVDNVRLPGVKVRATLTAGSGSLVDSLATTDSTGEAAIVWSTPTKTGSTTFGFSGELSGRTVTASATFSVFAGPATHVTTSADSLRFTKVGTSAVQVNAFDQYDNPSGVSVVLLAGSIGATLQDATLTVSSGAADASADIGLKSSTGSILKTVKVVTDFAIKAVTLVGVSDTAYGLAVGESKPFKFTVTDSGNASIAVSAEKAGIQFSSSDPAKLSVDAAGKVTGAGLGAATVTATRDAASLSLPLNVYAGYDLGAVTTLYVAPQSFEGQSSLAPRIAVNGASVVRVATCQTHPSGPCTSRVHWYSPSGAPAVNRVIDNAGVMTLGHDGSTFVSAPLARYDTAGNVVWTKTVNTFTVLADSTLLVVADTSTLKGLSLDGTELWSASVSSGSSIAAVSPARVYVKEGVKLVAFSRTGSRLWDVSYPGAGVADENSVYFGLGSMTISAIGPDGAAKWSYTADVVPRFVLGPDASVIVATANTLRWLDRVTGAERFNVSVPTSATAMSATPTRVFVSAPGGYLNVYNAATGEYLGRSTSPVAGGSFAPVCTTRGLTVSSNGSASNLSGAVSRFARCD